MTAQVEDGQAGGGRTGVYVYGILPGDVEVGPGTPGVGDPPGEVRAIRHRDLARWSATWTWTVRLAGPRTCSHTRNCSTQPPPTCRCCRCASAPCLRATTRWPTNSSARTHDEFDEALRKLDGHAEYVVKGRYVEAAVLREVLAENPEAARLGDQIRGADPDATRDQRMRLGEIVNSAVDAMRQADTRALGDLVSGLVTASVVPAADPRARRRLRRLPG